MPLQTYQVILVYGISLGSFLDKLEWLFSHKIKVAEIFFSSSAKHNFVKSKVI